MTFAYLNPIVAVGLGSLLLEDDVTAVMALASVAILVSVAATLRSRAGRSGSPSGEPAPPAPSV